MSVRTICFQFAYIVTFWLFPLHLRWPFPFKIIPRPFRFYIFVKKYKSEKVAIETPKSESKHTIL